MLFLIYLLYLNLFLFIYWNYVYCLIYPCCSNKRISQSWSIKYINPSSMSVQYLFNTMLIVMFACVMSWWRQPLNVIVLVHSTCRMRNKKNPWSPIRPNLTIYYTLLRFLCIILNNIQNLHKSDNIQLQIWWIGNCKLSNIIWSLYSHFLQVKCIILCWFLVGDKQLY